MRLGEGVAYHPQPPLCLPRCDIAAPGGLQMVGFPVEVLQAQMM